MLQDRDQLEVFYQEFFRKIADRRIKENPVHEKNADYVLLYYSAKIADIIFDNEELDEEKKCRYEEQNTQQETDLGNENLQIEALLPPEQLQQEEQRYWKDYEYFIQMLPMVAREVWIVGDALLDQYEYKGSPIYSEYPDKVTILKIADMVYDKLKYREEQEMIQADDEEMIRNPYFVEVSLRDAITPFRTLIQVILHWNINHRRQRYYRRQKVFSTQ